MIVVAVDGPAGSGKSSVSKAAAKQLGFDYVDTGAAYRALAWACLDQRIDLSDDSRIESVLLSMELAQGTDPAHPYVMSGSKDISSAIRAPEVSAAVSRVARFPAVREWMGEYFRAFIVRPGSRGVIIEGRDITTVVAPDAEIRILLTASEKVRASRRVAEIDSAPAETTASQLKARDEADSKISDFMVAAPGVVTVDSTHLDFEETVAQVVQLVTKRASS